jgi:signal transduction histidine kinase/DNA-binding NarL/FixJ family response regulator
MKRFSAYSLRARIILLGLILVVPLVLLFIVRSESNAQQDNLVILAVVVLACIGAAVLAARRLILDPLQKLGDAAVAIGDGRFDAAQGMSGAAPELSRTLSAIGDMAALLQRREQELKMSESRYRMLADAIEAMQDGVAVYDAEDRLVLFNEALRRHRVAGQEVFTVGRSHGDIVSTYWGDLHGGDAAFQEDAKVVLERHRRGDGSPWEAQDRDGRWHLTRHFRSRDSGTLTVSTDITALKKAEAVRAEEMLIDAIEAMQDAVALYDSDERLILANRALMVRTPRFLELLDEGTRFEDVLRGFWVAEREAFGDGPFEDFIQSRIEHFRRADGLPVETETTDGNWCESRHFRTRDGGTISVNTDITVAKRAAVEVEAARDAAEAANHAKSAFLASMSHEIRTPMNGVLGFTDLLLDTDLSAVQHRYLRGIQEAGKSLLTLINDILDLSKIEAGKLELERVPMSPAAIVDGAASILRSQFAAKAIDLRVEHGPDVPMWIEGDPTRVRQILLNLMSNALKFTDRGHVFVRSSLRHVDGGDLLRFEVQDTGIGIPADRQHLLFHDFSQVDRSTTRRFGGTGLGLAICKRLVEAMGGEIGVISEPDAGSTFWFNVAGSKAAAPENLKPVWLGREGLPAKILVAEDLPMNQLVIEGYLRGAGHDVRFAANGVEAVAVIEAEQFDLVLMDMEMPEMDGITATRTIRASNWPMRDVPIVALTANALLEDAALCRAAGMNDFLSKPIDRSALYAMIARWALPEDGQDDEAGVSRARPRILDPGVVDELENLLGKQKTAEFVEMSRAALVAITPTFVAWDDADAVARDAHKLISIAGNIGCMELVQLGRDVSAVIRNPQQVGAMRNTLVAALERALAALHLRFPAETAGPLVTNKGLAVSS